MDHILQPLFANNIIILSISFSLIYFEDRNLSNKKKYVETIFNQNQNRNIFLCLTFYVDLKEKHVCFWNMIFFFLCFFFILLKFPPKIEKWKFRCGNWLNFLTWIFIWICFGCCVCLMFKKNTKPLYVYTLFLLTSKFI